MASSRPRAKTVAQGAIAQPRSGGARAGRTPLQRARSHGLGVLSAWIVVFLALPLVALLIRAAQSDSVAHALADPAVYQALRLSAITSVLTLILSILFGLPLALLLARHHFRGSRVLDTLVDLPMVLPPTVA